MGTSGTGPGRTLPCFVTSPSARDVSPRPAGLVDAAGGSERPHGVHFVHEVVAVEAVVVHNFHLEADGALDENTHWSPDTVAYMVNVATEYRRMGKLVIP